MNDTQREIGGTGSGSKNEDLDVVLGRFKDWAETRRSKPSANPGAGAGSGRSLGEAREVTYEEALRASSYRRSADLAWMDPLLPEFNSEKTARVKVEEDVPRGEGAHWKETSVPSTSAVGQTPWPESRFVEAIPAASIEPPSLVSDPDFRDGPRPAGQIKMQDCQPKEALSSRAKFGIAEAPDVTAYVPRNAQVVQVAASPEAAPKPKSSTRPRKQLLAQPAFRDVLKGTAALVAAAQPGAAPLERAKSTSLTLRVSEDEQARIQACAAQANLSVSAYLRQCALGVDDLRNQVELALSTLHEQQARAAPPPGLSAIPGILGRSAMQCFRRLRRNSEDYTVVSLR